MNRTRPIAGLLGLLLACARDPAPSPSQPKVEPAASPGPRSEVADPEEGAMSACRASAEPPQGTASGIAIKPGPSGGAANAVGIGDLKTGAPKSAAAKASVPFAANRGVLGVLAGKSDPRARRGGEEGRAGSRGVVITGGDAFGGLPGSQAGDAGGIGGIGTSGMGIGGGGWGSGHGRGSGAIGGKGEGYLGKAEGTHTKSRYDVEKSPWAYAEINLPHEAGSTPGKFPGRDDAKINETVEVKHDFLSTFGADVDTAAYSIARRALRNQRLPEASIVRVEEFVNYFHYDYEPPREAEGLFSIQADGARAPTAAGDDSYVLRIGLEARVLDDAQRKPANLVFLVDTSCSMTPEDRLPLVKKSLEIAVDRLTARDTVAVTTYAGGVSLVLRPTPGDQKERIKSAIRSLTIGGGTAMASGLHLAYAQAAQTLHKDAISRIIVCSDGDANIGATSPDQILAELHSYVSEGVTLSTIGYGDDNYRDAMMQKLADSGNGNYFYVDTEAQAQRVFGRDFTKMIQDVAQDVKIQVEFDADAVKSYRLLGYEKRDIADQDFRNDKVDAGEIGAGHQVTALYALELNPKASGRLGTVRVRAKQPRVTTAKESALPLMTALVQRSFDEAPADLRFAAAVAGAAEIFRTQGQGSQRTSCAPPYMRPGPCPTSGLAPRGSTWTIDRVLQIARAANPSNDPDRTEFIALMQRAKALMPRFAQLSQ